MRTDADLEGRKAYEKTTPFPEETRPKVSVVLADCSVQQGIVIAGFPCLKVRRGMIVPDVYNKAAAMCSYQQVSA